MSSVTLSLVFVVPSERKLGTLSSLCAWRLCSFEAWKLAALQLWKA
jgi:hypothetical protein